MVQNFVHPQYWFGFFYLNCFGKWVWCKINPPGDRRFESLVPFARCFFGVPIFDPYPNEGVFH